MKILILNCGSSSIKYQFIETGTRIVQAKGSVERIGMKGALLKQKRHDGDEVKITGEIIDHQAGVEYILSILLSKNHGVIENKSQIDAVGHRVVHGGEKFTGSVLINDEVMKGLEDCMELAPLHNPPNIKGIKACQRLLPKAPMVGVFDTAFHHTLPDYAYMYGLPYVLYKRYGIRRYGFHGSSHLYVSQRAAVLLEKPIEELRIITCHLGNGASMAAVKGGKSIDTTMGFTPVEGLLMGTRCGDIDPAAILHTMGCEELTLGEANSMMNKHSGLYGISGISSDMREIIEEAEGGSQRAELALEMYCYRVKKYIGAYAAVLGGLDAIVFTGGIGENAPEVRQRSLSGLDSLGVVLDPKLNIWESSAEHAIHDQNSSTAIIVIPTNEELVIALDTEKLIGEVVSVE
ncbi:acetate kinase [candidate division LCP-89 bacterium B3_LCP]|uniref:Acetate kinase n=1 Tax=candidate division LCP-89 bacterium B3_LCP TaxID=2012998 RepID=A0A532V5K1_UNCL8|nr:MAG: acetate kinase [candidate division LCP-89 bacterium B3_LCP]